MCTLFYSILSSTLTLRLSQIGFYSRDGMVAINQTRSQKDKVFGNKKHYHTHKRLTMCYEMLWT